MADIKGLVDQIAGALEGEATAEDDGTYTIIFYDDEAEAEEPVEAAAVVLYTETIDDGPAKGQDILVMRSAAGELDESMETYLIEEAAVTWFARTYLEEEEGDDRPTIIIEAAVPLPGLTIDIASHAVLEVVDLTINARDFVLNEGLEEE